MMVIGRMTRSRVRDSLLGAMVQHTMVCGLTTNAQVVAPTNIPMGMCIQENGKMIYRTVREYTNFKMAKFPIVCSNYDFTGTPLADIVKPYAIIYRKGVKIGVFGLGPELKGLVTEANYGSIKYEDPIAKANEMVNILKKQEKCDVIICISHLGWDIDGIDDTEMVSGTRDIDLVLGGHSHTYFKQLQYRKNLDGFLYFIMPLFGS